MFYDLNVRWPQSPFPSAKETSTKSKKGKGKAQEAEKDDPGKSREVQVDCLAGLSQFQKDAIRALTEEMIQLGFSILAFNHIISSKFNSSIHSNPFYSVDSQSSLPPFPDLDPRFNTNSNSNPSSASSILQLSRLTLNLDSSSLISNSHNLLLSSSSTSLLTYDLLSTTPFDETSFQLTCLSLTEPKPTAIDIISLDLSSSNRLPFFLKRSTVSKALENGAVFEVCYSSAIGFQSDLETDGKEHKKWNSEEIKRRRKNLIGCTRDLLRQTNGKGVILSSGVGQVLGLRGPGDVVNLAYIFGMTPQAAKDSISSNCRSLIIRAQTRKTFRGLISDPKILSRPSEKVVPHPLKLEGVQEGEISSTAVGVGDGNQGQSVAGKKRDRDGWLKEKSKGQNQGVGKEGLSQKGKGKEKERQQDESTSNRNGEEIPDPGLDMDGIGEKIKDNGNSGNGVGQINRKGEKRKAEEEEEEINDSRKHSSSASSSNSIRALETRDNKLIDRMHRSMFNGTSGSNKEESNFMAKAKGDGKKVESKISLNSKSNHQPSSSPPNKKNGKKRRKVEDGGY